MKRLCSFALASMAIAWMSASLSLCAAPVGEAEATAAAKGFLLRSGVAARVLPDRSVAGVEERGGLWIAALEPSGHVVLAGSTKAPPIVSFSPYEFAGGGAASPYSAKLADTARWCDELEADDDAAENADWAALASAAEAAAAGASSSSSRRRSQTLFSSHDSSSALYVAPFIGANWGQGAPMNDLTPQSCPCGCMATAGGQEFRYWRWPYRFERSRTVYHRLTDNAGETGQHVIRMDGRVPFDWDKVSASGTSSTPWLADKEIGYNTAYVTTWAQSLVKMIFAPGASGGSQKLCAEAEDYWYEKGPVMSKGRDGYDNLWTAITNDLAFGSPIQINTPNHQMVIDGYAVDNPGADGQQDWVNINYGWGNPITWVDLRTEIESRQLADFQIGFRPQKIVQFEPVPKVSASSVPLAWHIAPCYTNRIDGFSLAIAKSGDATTLEDDFSASTGEATTDFFKVEDGYLGGYPKIQDSTFTYPETYFATADASLSFTAQSRYMSGHTATVEIQANGAAWEKVYTIALSPNRNNDFDTPASHAVDLSAYAGMSIRLRFHLACTWAPWGAGGTADFRIDNLALEGVKKAVAVANETIARTDGMPSEYSYTASGLDDGKEYTFTVTPVMTDGSAARANTVATAVGTPAAAPAINAVSSVACGLELVQQGFYVECARGIVNTLKVTCSEATTALAALPSHLSVLPDEKVSVAKNGNVFTVSLDATDMDAKWNGDMILLTLVATNADGTEAAKNLMLRFNGMRQVLDGTFDVVDADASTPVWFCGTTTIDAKGLDVAFAANAFQGNGCTVTLVDSVGGGSFSFASLDGFYGTLKFADGVEVSLPSDMTGFVGAIDGLVEVSSGTTSISSAASFPGGISVAGGTLVANTGGESNITLAGGTLKIKLTAEQVAYGYSASIPSYIAGSVVFVKPDGSETPASASGTSFSFAATANIWTGTDWWIGDKYSNTSAWSLGTLPSEGDYVVFKDASTDGSGALMSLNLANELSLAYIRTVGNTYFEIDTFTSDTTKRLSVGVFENEIPVKFDREYLVPTVVIPRAKLTIANGMTLSCDIDYTLAQNIKTRNYTASGEYNAIQYSHAWLGTVVFTNYTASGMNPGEYGNTNSIVRLNGVSGWLATNKEYYPTVELVDPSSSTPALLWNNGSGASTVTFNALSGNGTFQTAEPSKGGKESVLVKDVSGFTGSFKLAAKKIAIADTIPIMDSDLNSGRLYVCKDAAIASGATWAANAGVWLGDGVDLAVRGTLDTSASPLKFTAAGATLTLEDGGTVVAGATIAADYAATLDFKAGTYRFSDSATETNTVNFCAAEGSFTTIDTFGNTVTLGENFFSGSGDVYLANSNGECNGKIVIKGISPAFTGKIRYDGSNEVVLPDDLSVCGGTLCPASTTLTLSSSKLGSIEVGEGATLTVVLTDSQAMKGFAADSVTLAGGTIEFMDSDGTVIGSSTESTTYTKPDGYYIGAVPTAVWVAGEFDDDASTHAGYAISVSGAGTIGKSSGTIVISSGATKGATIALSSVTNVAKASVLVKFTAPSGGAPVANAAIAGAVASDGYPISPVCTSAGGSTFIGGYLDKNSNYTLTTGNWPLSPVPTLNEGEGFMLFSFQSDPSKSTSHGTALYLGTSIASLSGGNASRLQWSGDHAISEIAVGGSTYEGVIGAWAGLEIEAVALFADEWLAPEDVEFFEFPEADVSIEDYPTLDIASGETWKFAAGATRQYENIGTLSSGGTIAVTNDAPLAEGVYKLAEWTAPQILSTGYGRVGSLSVPAGYAAGCAGELVYGAKAIYLRVYDTAAQAARGTLKIWPYGDSITEGFNASNTKANYRALVAQKLTLLGFNVEMVGCYDKIQTATASDLEFMDAIDPSGEAVPDAWKWHSAKHGGTVGVTAATSYERSAMVENVDTLAVQAGTPDVVLLHGGINDLYASGQTPASVFANWTNTVQRLVDDLPNTKIVVSTLLYGDAANAQRKTNNSSVVEPFNTLVTNIMDAANMPSAWIGRVFLADLNSYVQTYRDDAAPAGITADNLHPDWWGHDQMAEGWLSVITNQFTATQTFPSATDPAMVDASALGAAAKTELDGYRDGFTLAQIIDVASTNAPTVTATGEGTTANIGKVGYFVEYVRADNEGHKWVWADMDAFGDFDLASAGLPAANRQQAVTSLHVKSNHNGIDDIAADDDTATGWIEFSPHDYAGASSGVSGAPAAHGGKSMFDWNDTLSESGTTGSMQLFRVAPPSGRPAQLLFAYNNWQSAETAAEFGIGNFAQHFWGLAQTLDCTYTKGLEKMNASAYRVKRIEIWTKPIEESPEIDSATIANTGEGAHDQATFAASEKFTISIPASDGFPVGTLVRLDSVSLATYASNALNWRNLKISAENGEVLSDIVNGTGATSGADFGSDTSAKKQTFAFSDDCLLKVGDSYPIVLANADGEAVSQYARLVKTNASSPIAQSSSVTAYRILQEVSFRKVHTTEVSADAAYGSLVWSPAMPSDASGSFRRIVATANATLTVDEATSVGDISFYPAAAAVLTLSGEAIAASGAVRVYGGTVKASASRALTGAAVGDGTLLYTEKPTLGAGGLVATGDAWRGVLWLYGANIAAIRPPDCAGTNSVLRLTGCTGYFNDAGTAETNPQSCPGTLDLQDDGDAKAFTVSDGWSISGVTVFARLTGSGTLTTSKNVSQRYVFSNVSDFTGTLNIPSGYGLRPIFGETTTAAANGALTVSNATATIAEDVTWTLNGGIYLQDGGVLHATGNATVACKIISNDSDDTAIEVDEGKTLTVTGLVAGSRKIVKRGLGTLVLVAYSGSEAATFPVCNEGAVVLGGQCEHDLGALRDFYALDGYSLGDGSSLKVIQTQAEFGLGKTTLFNVPEAFASITLAKFDGSSATMTRGESSTVSLEEAKVLSGSACWHDYEFDNSWDDTGSEIQAAKTWNSDEPNFVQDGETANYFVYTAIRPGPAVKYDYPDEWSAAIRCTVPETANGVVVAFGNVTQGLANRNYIALVAGGTSGEVRLVKGNGNSACESLATMTVAHATSAQHVYVFTKTANAIAVYCDGDLINRVSIEWSLTGGFQFGTMYGNFQSGSGLVETTDKETGGTVDYMRLFNYALDEEMIQALADENPYVSDSDTFTRTLSGGESLEWVSEAAWSKGEEAAAAPDADGIVEVTAAADSAVSVNLAAAALYEELTIGGEGKVSLLLAEGAATLSATKVDAETDVTVEYGAADFSESRVSIADGKTLTFDFSSEPINGRATRSIVRLTGVTAAPADLGDESAWPVQIVRNSDASSLTAGYDETFWYDTDTLSYYYAYGPDHDGGAEVYYRDAAYWQNGNPAFAVTNAAGATTVVVAGDTVVIPEYFSGSEAWAADALPANVSKIRIARDFAFHSGVAGAIFDGVEFSVDSGKTLTFSRGNSANGVTLGSATLNGPGAVVLKSIAVSGAVSGSATATVASGTTVSVASGGSVANTLAGTGTVAFATPPTTALSFCDWSGTIELAAFAGNGQHLDFCDHAGAKIKLAGVTGGYLYWEDMTISAEVILAGDFILNDMSAKDYSFTKISGTGNICLTKGGQYELKSFEISEYSGTGAITNNMPNTAVSIGTLALPEGASVAPRTKLLATGGTGAVTVGKVTVGGVEQTGLELATKSDGIYVAGIEPVTPDNIDTYDTTGLNDEDLVLQVTYTPEGGEATTELISGILKVENGAVVLNPAASYEGVPVTPTLDATAKTPIDLSGETAAVFAFKAIAGLWYSVEYSGALAAGGLDATDTTAGETEPQQATATGAMTIAAPKAATGASGLFYRIRAAVKEEDS